MGDHVAVRVVIKVSKSLLKFQIPPIHTSSSLTLHLQLEGVSIGAIMSEEVLEREILGYSHRFYSCYFAAYSSYRYFLVVFVCCIARLAKFCGSLFVS